ncbi:MAG: hypothetical protein H6738_08250 [Alphaproteobacteria bacterium]|nr:hypothetical protein [Alphaproteobacteria bacterium]MCB9696751.1 hypothetical protein [Alphaproteobacteria bacterium]
MSTCVVVIERNRVAGQRIGRALSAACGAVPAVVADTLAEVVEDLPGTPVLLGCDVADLPAAKAAMDRWPGMQVVLWTTADVAGVVEQIRDDRRLRCVAAWPSFLSMPRPWELLFVARRLTDPMVSVPKLADLLAFGAHISRWRPRTADDRDRATEEVSALLVRSGVAARAADRAGEVVHELLMNAMYDAPVDGWGQARYAADRRQDVILDEAEIPTLRLGFDGVTVALEVHDPFGRLRDEHVLDGIVRYANNQTPVGGAPTLDTSHGGAGLGMGQIHAASMVFVSEVRPLESTRMLWFFDADVNVRDTRGMPSSLHLFRTDPPDRGSRP